MGYKPTLGGLKIAQEYLKKEGYPLPVFQINIYSGKEVGGYLGPIRQTPTNGQTASIDDLIREHGKMHQMEDVRLTDETGTNYIQFSNFKHLSCFHATMAAYANLKAVLEWPPEGPLGEFIEKRIILSSTI